PSLLLLLFPDLITYHQGWYLIPWPVGMKGLEPPTSRSQTGCSDQTELHPVGGILLAVPHMPGGRVWSGAPTRCLSSPLIYSPALFVLPKTRAGPGGRDLPDSPYLSRA